MGGHSRNQGRYTIYMYIYKERKETERRRDTETNMERVTGLHHILAIIQHITKDVCCMIAEIWCSKHVLQCTILSCLCFYSCAPMVGHSRDQGNHTIYVCGEKETERRRDTETTIEKGKGLHHIFAIIQHIMNNVCYRIAEI